jgi:hypothetical protein
VPFSTSVNTQSSTNVETSNAVSLSRRSASSQSDREAVELVDLRFGPTLKATQKAKAPKVQPGTYITVTSQNSAPTLAKVSTRLRTGVAESFTFRGSQPTPMRNRGLALFGQSQDSVNISKQLEAQERKPQVKVDVYGKEYIIPNPLRDHYDVEERLSGVLYDEIPGNDKYVQKIVDATGLKPKNIKKYEKHVFVNEHQLDSYGKVTVGRFDPNLDQALAWIRLENNKGTKEDLEWMKHEVAERHHERKFNSGYTAAHRRAEQKYRGLPWGIDRETGTGAILVGIRVPPNAGPRI